MGNAIETGLLLIIRTNNVPGSKLGICGCQHAVSRAGIFVPAAKRLHIHWAELPLAQRILDPCLETPLLFLLPNLQPILNEDYATVHDVFLNRRTDLKEFLVLSFAAKPHHVLHAGAVVPASVPNDNFSGRREVFHVALYVQSFSKLA